ncbi:NADH-cytochrome b5 reductase-like isoform X3 [Polyodon spathula]|uniref:NADH-cytochrome b5 reductase-like isoform X3 n=1 Tax=Polyodon spathula TaxID=7913 RepID=UPI001B7E1B0E|nr:NADH-cytochrome b5 reductase-like isoform X3 [Polyodon spathula]
MDKCDDEDWLLLKPKEPLPSQCCASGCKPCVFDTYERELEKWNRAREKGDIDLLDGKRETPMKSDDALINPDCFRAFQLESVNKMTEAASLYRFRVPNGGSLKLSLGQHLVLRGTVDGLEVQRAYTPVNRVNTEGYFEVLIKYGHLLMFVSGTGIAPMLSIIQYITDNEEDETLVTLTGCFRTYEDIYMKSLLEEQSLYWNVKTFYVLSKEETLENLPWSYREKTHLGRLNLEVVKTLVSSKRNAPFALICGSVTFNQDVLNYLKSAGLDQDSCFIF